MSFLKEQEPCVPEDCGSCEQQLDTPQKEERVIEECNYKPTSKIIRYVQTAALTVALGLGINANTGCCSKPQKTTTMKLSSKPEKKSIQKKGKSVTPKKPEKSLSPEEEITVEKKEMEEIMEAMGRVKWLFGMAARAAAMYKQQQPPDDNWRVMCLVAVKTAKDVYENHIGKKEFKSKKAQTIRKELEKGAPQIWKQADDMCNGRVQANENNNTPDKVYY